MEKISSLNKNFAQLEQELKEYRKTWDQEYYLKYPGIEQNWQNPDTDLSGWKDISIPNFWGGLGWRITTGLSGSGKHSTCRRVSKGIPLTSLSTRSMTTISPGSTGTRSASRSATATGAITFSLTNILKPKGNVLVVRVFDIGGVGGMYTSAFWGNPILNGEWKFKPGT
ncbi:MAG: hypothetical protein H6558_02945 [Lewinellaceae bacterium]|nr:hypothetical protein [Lewinellaceae bacterium]